MRALITGGSGTVGLAFIKEYGRLYDFAIYSRSEKMQWEAKQKFPDVTCFLGGIEEQDRLLNAYEKFKPDVVVHAAALKHIDLAEKNPIQACRVNILGTLNVIQASVLTRTRTTIGISTDKACSQSVYGRSKYLMERCFRDANSPAARFACCRFANVAKSNGSVIPKWLEAAARGEKLTITDPAMCRMIISQQDSARLIQKAVVLCGNDGGFVLLKKLKQLNILDLAKQISDNYEVTGARAGEKLHEALLDPAEIPYSQVLSDGYIKLSDTVNTDETTRFSEGYDSATTDRMSEQEIRDLIAS